MLESQEILLLARLIHTGTAASANALLIRDGRVAAVGDRADVTRQASHAKTIDLRDATLTPGLIDAHVHLTEWALTRAQTDLGAATTPANAASRMAAAAASARDTPSVQTDGRSESWVRGRGWNEHAWDGNAPNAAILDAAIPDRPAALQSHDMHSMWLNTAGLREAGIDRNTPDPVGGRIERDAAGEPTGILRETAAQLVLSHIPKPSAESTMAAVLEGQAVLHRLGITGVHSFPGIHIPDPDPFVILQRLQEDDVLRLRVLQHIARERLDAAIELGVRSGFGNDWITVGGVKLFLDGALGSCTAWMEEAYEDAHGPNARGVNVLERREFADIVTRAARAGIASTVHAIGDAAVSLALDELSPPSRAVAALPHRIEHVQCCPVSRLDDFRRANIIASMQPCHLMSDWRAADRHWGARGRNTFALRSLLNHGATLAFGSDAPVEPIDPRRSLYAALTRMDDEHEPTGGWYAAERITAREAIAGFTTGPALAAGTEGRQGVLQEGAWADIAAWDQDPFVAEPDMLLHIECVATLVAGTRVF